MMKELVLIFASLYGALAVVFGAFGAHLLKKKFTAEQSASFETGVKYQFYHAIVLLIVGLNIPMVALSAQLMAWFFIIGTFLFSFSIYGLCLSSAKGKKLKALGPITPLGGLLLVGGWVLLLIVVLQFGMDL